MNDNVELSKLSINFKMIINHDLRQLHLDEKGFLKTNFHGQEINPKALATVKETYRLLNKLLKLSPKQLQETDLDFKLYVSLIHRIIPWSQSFKPKGYDCDEKKNLLSTLDGFSEFMEEIEKEEKKWEEKKVKKVSSNKNLFALNGGPQKKPNILVILTDEEKKLTGYEGKEVKNFYKNKLVGKKEIKENGINFTQHRTASNACSPSRAILASGHYPTLTGIFHTNGLAKTSRHPFIKDLPPEVPTYGSYFKAGGYDTKYVGKVHFCHRDIIDYSNEKPQVKMTKKINEEPNTKVMQEYLKANVLSDYGLDGWVGGEPHGSSPHNSGYNRDPNYVAQITEWLKERDKKDDRSPFFAVVSLVNPHDIVYYPIAWLYFVYKYGFSLPGDEIKSIPIKLPPSLGDGLEDRPLVQQQYREQYSQMFVGGDYINGTYNGPMKEYNPFNYFYQKMYLFFQGLVDKQVQTIYQSLKQSQFYDNTYVVLSSDHGDNLGAHGLAQKWLTTDRESIEIDLTISHPKLINKGREYDKLTSHIDFLPTLLKLAGLDKNELLRKLKTTHSEAHPLVGKPIGETLESPEVNSNKVQVLDKALFITADNPTTGDDQRTLLAQIYNFPRLLVSTVEGIYGNTYIKMVEARLLIDNKKEHYKYASYTKAPYENKFQKDLKPEEVLYDLKSDPYERKNLIKEDLLCDQDEKALVTMRKLLKVECERKLIKPNDPTLLSQPKKHLPKILPERPGNDILFAIMTPPILALLAIAYLGYKYPKSSLVVGGALKAMSFYRRYQKKHLHTGNIGFSKADRALAILAIAYLSYKYPKYVLPFAGILGAVGFYRNYKNIKSNQEASPSDEYSGKDLSVMRYSS